jgi:hypothetical protein
MLTADDVADLTSETDSIITAFTHSQLGVLANVIFTNVVIADLLDEASDCYLAKAQRTNRKHGWTSAFRLTRLPCHHALRRKRKRIYFYDELYERGLTNDLLAEESRSTSLHADDRDYNTNGLCSYSR